MKLLAQVTLFLFHPRHRHFTLRNSYNSLIIITFYIHRNLHYLIVWLNVKIDNITLLEKIRTRFKISSNFICGEMYNLFTVNLEMRNLTSTP